MNTRLTARDGERLNQARDAHVRGQLSAAQPIYQRLARKYPRNDDVRSLLAALHLDIGAPERALPLLRGLVRSRPSDANLHYNLGVAHAALGAHEDAIISYRRAVACDSNHDRAHYNLAVAYEALGREELALSALLTDFELAARVDTCRRLSTLCEARGDLPSALLYARRCVEIEGAIPQDLHRMVDLSYQHCAASSVVSERNLSEFLALAEHGVRLQPTNPTALVNAARMYTQAGQFHCALPLLESAVQIAPDDAAIRTLLGVVLCTTGNAREGWRQRSWLARAAEPINADGVPRWRGEDLNGKSILVTCEQGVGDQVLYARMLPRLAQQQGEVTFVCDPRLVALLTRTYPQIHCVEQAAAVSQFDYFVPLGELHIYDDGTQIARLVADPDRTLAHKARYAGKRAVGLSWLSHSGANGAAKSVPLRLLEPLLARDDLVFVNLQYGGGEQELQRLFDEAGVPLINPGVDLVRDLDEAAALIASVDDLVTVSNATAHMAGGLGVRTHVLVGQRPVWHWQDQGQSCMWYPSVRLYRQAGLERESWQAPMAHVVEAVR